jgi:hypothetical protein
MINKSNCLGQSFEHCLRDETTAQQQLTALWSANAGPVRDRCEAEATVDENQSYVDLLTCMQAADLVNPPSPADPLRGASPPPRAPDPSLAGVRLAIADHAMGLPVLRTLSLCTCRRHYPGAASERIASLNSFRRISLPRKGCRVDLRIVLFEDYSAFTRVAACTLALSPIRDSLIEASATSLPP